MHKNYLAVFLKIGLMVLFAFSASISLAQKYTFIPSKVLKAELGKDDVFMEFEIEMENISGKKLSLTWKPLENTLLNGWDYSLCDLGTCLTVLPEVRTMDTCDVGEKAFFLFSLTPNGIVGKGKLVLKLFETGNEIKSDTVVFDVTVNSTSSVSKNQASSMRIYPNPVTGKTLQLKGDVTGWDGYEISDLTGTVIDGGPFHPAISVADLNPGVYFLTLRGRNNRKVTHRFFRR